MICSHAHLVLTNLLTTSLLVLWFSQWFLLFLPPNFFWFHVTLDSYSDICYLGTDELIIFVSFLWMIWVDLPFLIYLLSELKAFSTKHFPQDICQTTKQVDAFVISRSRKICFVGPELTVPIEERLLLKREKKRRIWENDSRSWHLAGNWNALLQKLVVEDISHLLSEKHFNSLDSLRRNWKPLLMNVLWLVEDQATTSGSTVFIRLSFHFRWFK